jgi:hypothetical protein
MIRNGLVLRDFRFVGLMALATVACSQPPSELITEARHMENEAMVVGAKEYSPDAFDAVTESRVALEAEMAAQAERWSARRSYKQAEVLASAYRAAGEEAVKQAEVAREEAHAKATAMITDGRAALEEVRSLLAVAPVGKGSAADLAAMRGDLDAAQAALDEAEEDVTSSLFMEASASATSAREMIEGVRNAVEAARALRRG